MGTVLAINSYTRDIAVDAIGSGATVCVSFGRPYIGRPDSSERFEQDKPAALTFRSTRRCITGACVEAGAMSG